MSLLDFLKAPRNSVAREKLLHMKAALEMRLHAAKFEAQIQMTEPEIDNNGYDFTVSHGHYHLYLQNKSVIKNPVGKNRLSIRFFFSHLSVILTLHQVLMVYLHGVVRGLRVVCFSM